VATNAFDEPGPGNCASSGNYKKMKKKKLPNVRDEEAEKKNGEEIP
jgi:hypothetical protein